MAVTGDTGFRQAGDRHRFSVGYPPLEKEGAVLWIGIIQSVSPETNCDLEKSAPVARDRIKESRPRAP
jgi:hypothetical protein